LAFNNDNYLRNLKYTILSNNSPENIEYFIIKDKISSIWFAFPDNLSSFASKLQVNMNQKTHNHHVAEVAYKI